LSVELLNAAKKYVKNNKGKIIEGYPVRQKVKLQMYLPGRDFFFSKLDLRKF
jgi:hypothetical protein